MPTTPHIIASKDSSAINATSYTWNGFDQHHPVGWIGATNTFLCRSFVYFPLSFTGWTGITSATLFVRGANFHTNPTGGLSRSLNIRRMTSDWGEGAGSENNWTTSSWSWTSTANAWTSANGTALAFTSIAVGTWYSVDITAIVQDWFNGSANYGVVLFNSNEASYQYSLEFSSRHVSGSEPYVVINYSTNTAPSAPVSLSPTGNAVVNNLAPTLAGTRSDPDVSDTMGGYQIQVYKDDGVTLVWDSGSMAASGAASFSKAYAGSALTGNTFYQWKARTYDTSGAWGPYSALQRFKVNTSPSAPTVSLATGTASDLNTLTPSFVITHNDPDPGDSNMYGYHVIVRNPSGTAVWDSGDVDTSASPANSKTIAYGGSALSWGTAYTYTARTKDINGAWSVYSANQTFTTHLTGTPTSLVPVSGATLSSITPTFTGSRASTADSLSQAEVKAYASDGVTLVWDSAAFTGGVTASSFSKAYGGSTLSNATTYKWQARVFSTIGGWSNWSALVSVTTPAAGTPTTTAPAGNGITTLTPTFTADRSSQTFNDYEIIVYEADGVTVHYDTGARTQTLAGTLSYVYAGTALVWGGNYQWKVRVSSDSGTTWSAYSALQSFQTGKAGQPTLTAPADSAWVTTVTPTFTGTTFNSETISTFRVEVFADDQVTLVWDSGNVAGSSTSFSKVCGISLSKGRKYYWQASYVETGNIPGDFSALQMFHVNADPQQPTAMTPAAGAVVASLSPYFTATFSDNDIATWGDFPTKLDIEVWQQGGSAYISTWSVTTGLVTGANTTQYQGVALVYDTTYQWRARYTDSKSVLGPWSSFFTFKPSRPPAPAYTSLTNGGTIAAPRQVVTWSLNSPSGKAQSQYQLTIQRTADQVQVYDSGQVTTSTTTHTVPGGYLQNGVQYNFALDARDTDGL